MKQKHCWNSLGVVIFRFIYIQYNFLSFHRCKKVYDGVTHAAKLYPNAYVIMILIGTLKGKLKFLLPETGVLSVSLSRNYPESTCLKFKLEVKNFLLITETFLQTISILNY